jgi:hypothetical protein
VLHRELSVLLQRELKELLLGVSRDAEVDADEFKKLNLTKGDSPWQFGLQQYLRSPYWRCGAPPLEFLLQRRGPLWSCHHCATRSH